MVTPKILDICIHLVGVSGKGKAMGCWVMGAVTESTELSACHSGLGVLLDPKGTARRGLSRWDSRVISRHTYISTPILISNSIIHPEIENPPYPCHPTGRTEFHSPMIYLPSGCLPPGPLHQFMSRPVGNLPSQQASLVDWAACILLPCVHWIYGALNWDLIYHFMKAVFSRFIYDSPSEWYRLLPSVRNCFSWFHFTVWHTADVQQMPGAGRGRLDIALGMNVLGRAQNLFFP